MVKILSPLTLMFTAEVKQADVTQPCFSSYCKRVSFITVFSSTFLHLCALVILLFKVTPRHSAEVLSSVLAVQEVHEARDVPYRENECVRQASFRHES